MTLLLVSTSSTSFLFKSIWSLLIQYHSVRSFGSPTFIFLSTPRPYLTMAMSRGVPTSGDCFCSSLRCVCFLPCLLILCAQWLTLICNSHRPKLGAPSSNLPWALAELGDAKGPGTNPGRRDPRIAFPHLAACQGIAGQRAAPTFCQPNNPKHSLHRRREGSSATARNTAYF